MLVLTTNNKSVDWICKLMKVLLPSPLFMYVQVEMRETTRMDQIQRGQKNQRQWRMQTMIAYMQVRFMMFNFGARWDQAFFAKGCKLYNPVYVITDHSALTTRSQVYSACLLCHFENTLSFNAEKIVSIFSSRLIQIILFSHLAIAHIYCLVKIIVRSTSYITQQVKWVNKRSWT